jgi:sugar O-acyltransferase (sialic acid O-acetyltransferase NeuD family)
MKYLIYGSSDFALILKDFLDQHQMPVEGFIDDFKKDDPGVLSFDEVVRRYRPDECEIVFAIGYGNLPARLEAYRRLKGAGFRAKTLIHRNAYVRDPAKIGEGAIVMANATVDCNAVIGEIAVLWPGVVVNHDSVVSRNTFLSPSATVCGFVTVGESCFVGAGAVIVDHVEVPAGSFIKAATRFKGER